MNPRTLQRSFDELVEAYEALVGELNLCCMSADSYTDARARIARCRRLVNRAAAERRHDEAMRLVAKRRPRIPRSTYPEDVERWRNVVFGEQKP